MSEKPEELYGVTDLISELSTLGLRTFNELSEEEQAAAMAEVAAEQEQFENFQAQFERGLTQEIIRVLEQLTILRPLSDDEHTELGETLLEGVYGNRYKRVSAA